MDQIWPVDGPGTPHLVLRLKAARHHWSKNVIKTDKVLTNLFWTAIFLSLKTFRCSRDIIHILHFLNPPTKILHSKQWSLSTV